MLHDQEKIIQGKSILIVDDEELFREIWDEEFSSHGAKIYTAENGLQALEILKQNKIDLIISDYNMPKMNGLELMDEVVNNVHEQTPFIFIITGQSNLTAGDLCERGADAVFMKPCRAESVVKAVQTIFSLPERRFRRYERVPLQNKGLLFDVNNRKSGEISFTNVSAGGCAFKINSPVELGDSVFIEFSVITPAKEITFRFDALVRWAQQEQNQNTYFCGVEFLNAKPDEKITLEAWIHTLSLQVK